MFYFDNFYGKKVLKSDCIKDIMAFFTTREGFEPERLCAGRILKPVQTHGENIETVDNRTEYPDTDALILKTQGDAVYLRFADCTPLIFYNPKTYTAAVSHAGWRGTVQKIGVKTIEKMGGNPEDIIAVIGPAIGICCYEVSEEVKEKLLLTVKDTSELYKGRFVDLKRINARQLKEAGVRHIAI